MLSRTSKEEILRKLDSKVGFPVSEKDLSMGTRQAIANLAAVQRNIFVISEILYGEQSRIEGSVVLTVASKVRKDKEIASHASEIEALQAEISNKVSELSDHILQEVKAKESGTPPPSRYGNVEAVQLKCPNCGAALPMPTGRFTICQYCNTTVSIQDVSSQIKAMIQSI
jgi:hypothetical protein